MCRKFHKSCLCEEVGIQLNRTYSSSSRVFCRRVALDLHSNRRVRLRAVLEKSSTPQRATLLLLAVTLIVTSSWRVMKWRTALAAFHQSSTRKAWSLFLGAESGAENDHGTPCWNAVSGQMDASRKSLSFGVLQAA